MFGPNVLNVANKPANAGSYLFCYSSGTLTYLGLVPSADGWVIVHI